LMMRHMDKKRQALKLHPLMYAESFLSRTASQEAESEAELISLPKS